MIGQKDLKLFEKRMQDESFQGEPGTKILAALLKRMGRVSDSTADEPDDARRPPEPEAPYRQAS